MSRYCEITQKKPMSGNNVSHARNRTKRRFLPNIHNKKYWLTSEARFIKLNISAKGLRIIDKLGIEKVLERIKLGKTF